MSSKVKTRSLRLVTIAGFCLGTALAAGAQSPPYLFGRGDFPVDANPFAVVTADFNGDGRLDLASIGANPTAAISVLLGQADGGFATHVDYPVDGFGPLVVGDFNHDGKPDLAVGNGYAPFTLQVLLGNGDGTFQSPVNTSLRNAPAAMAAGDFNNDGNLDVAISYGSQASMAVLLGRGDGTFETEQDSSTRYQTSAVAVGDFNGDGKLDLVTADNSITPGRVSVYLGNGNGAFQNPQDLDTADGTQSVIVADMNGDGILDLVSTCTSANRVSVLLGKGDGTFNTAVSTSTVTGPSQAVPGDFNGDGIEDLAVASGTVGLAKIMIGKGDGSFRNQVEFSAPAAVYGMVAGDYNRDGKLDLAMAAEVTRAQVSVLVGDGDGTFPAGKTVATGALPTAVAGGDFNGDGIPDLAVADGTGVSESVSILLGSGRGNFKKAVAYSATPLINSFGIVAADFNLDGALDLAVTGPTQYYGGAGAVDVLLGNGDGTFQTAVEYVTSQGTSPEFLLSADFNNDGIPDLAVVEYAGSGANETPEVGIFLGNGDGTFQPRVDYKVSPQPWSMAAGDFNNDGILDLAVTSGSNNTFSVLMGNGNGTFQSGQAYAAGNNPYGIVAADFNGDGFVDLATTDYASDQFGIFPGSGNGTFPTHTAYRDGIDAVPVVVGDINNDGKPDLVMAATFGNSAAAFINSGTGAFGSAIPFGTNGSPGDQGDNGLLLADVDGNGTPDVAITNYVAGQLSLLLNVPVPAFSSSSLNFGNQAVGTSSGPMVLTLCLASAQPLHISSAVVTGDFVEQNHCPHTLKSGNCQIEVEFRPTSQGTLTGTLVLTDDGAGYSQTIALTGQGTPARR